MSRVARPVSLFWVAAMGLLLLAACDRGVANGNSETDPSAPEPLVGGEQAIEILTWWGQLGQSNPVGIIKLVHRKQYPGDTVLEPKTMFRADMDKILAARMGRNEPPDVFQTNIGTAHRRWILRDGKNTSSSQLLPLDDLVAEAKPLRMLIAPEIRKHVIFDNQLYAIPATIHRINTLYYNKRVFKAHNLAPPRTVADLLHAGEVLRNAGIPLLAFGARDPWMFSWIIWESLLVAEEGADFYEDYFSGKLEPDDPRMIRTLRTGLLLLHEFGNRNWRDQSWIQSADQLRQGAVATLVNGDWTTTYFAYRGLRDDDSTIGEIPFPGTENTFIFTSDVFVLPVAASNRRGAIRLLSTIASAETQRELAVEKGCLSPRVDVMANLNSEAQKQKERTLKSGRLLLAASGKIPTFFVEELLPAFSAMLEQNDIEPMVLGLKSRYCLLKPPPLRLR